MVRGGRRQLRILPYAEGTSTDLLVATGRADVGVSFEESVVQTRAKNQDVVSIAAVIQKNTSALVVANRSGVSRPRELDDKRYAGFGAAFEQPMIERVIKCDGGEGKYRSITANLFGYQAVKSGQADFVWIYMGWEGVQAEREGLDLNAFYINQHCIPDYYTPVLIASGKGVEQNADALRRFLAATARGYEFGVEDPEEAARLLVQAAPKGTFPDPGLVTASQKWLAPKYSEGQERWGVQTLQKWTDYPRFMYGTGKVTDASGKPTADEPDYEAYFTNDLLPR
ncbi:MAG: ABC transporter substrate-binding protein [Chloroflexia bacterium]